MTPEQTAAVWALVMQVCPGQRYDAFTPQAWAEVLRDVDYDDAVEAVRRAAQERAFIGTADICKGVTAIRRDRWEAATKDGPLPWPPDVDRDDVDAVVEARKRDVAAILDGLAAVERTEHGRWVVRRKAIR